MATFITALMHNDNRGQSTFFARAHFFASLRTDGIKFTIETPCTGYWFENDELYTGITTLVTMHGSEAAIRRIVGEYGTAAGQIEMLLVERKADYSHIVSRGKGEARAIEMALVCGGATLLPDGYAVSFDYAALVAGVDYSDRNVVRK